MTSLWQVPAVVAVLLAWLASPPASLADAARHEAVRRLLFAKSAVAYTNATLPSPSPTQAAEGATAAAPDATDPDDEPLTAAPPASDAAVPAKPVAESAAGGDEQAWHDRMAALQTAVENDELLADGMQSRVSSLQNDLSARDDPAERAVLRDQLDRALVGLDRIQAQVVADRAAIEKLKEDARRQGVPPGWIR